MLENFATPFPVLMLSLSFLVGAMGHHPGSPPRSSPGSSTGILDRFGSGGWATTPAEPGRNSINVTLYHAVSHIMMKSQQKRLLTKHILGY